MGEHELISDVESVASTLGDLVVVGSSAGGVEALSILVTTLPANFPAPIVLAQHLDPSRHSNLDAILQRRTTLSIEVVNSRSLLQAGKIYVVPANRHVAIYDGHVEVQDQDGHSKRPKPSVDLLLSSAAKVYGERLIAVILTGSGSDGAAGAVDVKNAGGIVVVQDPRTARFPSMPLALPPTVVDFEANIERIGSLLYDLLTGVDLPQPEERTEDMLRGILEQVSRQASIDFRSYKTSTILRRIARRMTVTHNDTMGEYLDYLKSNPEEIGALVKAFLINVTQFFRDPEAFNYLKREVLPKLIEQARESDHILRFWTAGCATGEEPYSLAMLLTDLLGVELPEWSVKIFATDPDEAAINFARRGLYTESLLKDIPTEYKERFFERVDHGYRISKTLRQIVIFGQQDLSRSAPFPRIDLILCRNVLIYFTPELQEYVLNQFAFSLSHSGYLFLGKSETVRPLQAFYELVNKHWKVYRCTGKALPAARRPSLTEMNAPRLEGHSSNHATKRLGKQESEQESPAPVVEVGQLRRFNELLFRFLPIGVVVIDRRYRVLTANGVARRLLGLRDIPNEQDFLHAVRGIPYSEARSAIDAVFREHNTLTLSEVELDNTAGGNSRCLSLSIAPVQLEANAPDQAVISVTDVTEQIQTRRQLEVTQAEQSQLMHELSAANKRLNDVNKELLDANEEFQVANEELMLTQEELQASIEEFETTNEELQATNEELETNNEELQATNEELETTNEELRARTSELQEMSNILEGERTRLAEMVELAPFYIIVLRGPNLLVEAVNPLYTELFAGRFIAEHSLEEVFDSQSEGGIELVRLAKEVYRQDSPHTTSRMLMDFSNEENERTERYFVHTIVPTHSALGKVSGVVIYSKDETEQRAREAEEELERLKLIFNNTEAAALALYDAQSTELITGSPYYLALSARVNNLSQDALTGRTWYDLTLAILGGSATSLWNSVLENLAPLRLPEVHLKLPQNEQETILDWRLTPIFDTQEEDTIRFMLVSAVDITEQAKARQEMERLNNLKDNFLALVSHELRTPLTSMLGNAELLQSSLEKLRGAEAQKPDFEAQERALESIIHQAHLLNRLIDEMVDITRIRSEQFELKKSEQVNIVALVQQVIEQQYATSTSPVTLETQEIEVAVTGDEARLEQVLNNLISNAIKYSPAGKPVVVGIRNEADEVIISVRDEGSGISKEEQYHIFERFYRAYAGENAKVEGLGLGLFIAHQIVVQHGGHMWLESSPGKGSTFYFSLPLPKHRQENS